MLWIFSIWLIWLTGGVLFAAYLFDIKPAGSIRELSSNKFKIGLILIMSGPAFILAVFAVWVEDKVSPPIRHFINWLIDAVGNHS